VWWRVGTLAAAAASHRRNPGRRGNRARLPTNTSERPQTRQRRHGLPETLAESPLLLSVW
jgi:hypothetical protein